MEPTLFQDLRSIAVRYRRRLSLAVLTVLLSNLLLILNPLIFRQAVAFLDPTINPAAGFFNTVLTFVLGAYTSSVWAWAFLLLTIAVVSAYLKFRMRVVFISVSRDVEAEVRSYLFNRIQNQSQSFFDRHRIGGLMSRLTNDISEYREVLGPGILYPCNFVTLTLPAMAALFSILPKLAMISAVPVFLLPWLILFVRRQIYRDSTHVQEGLADMNTMAQEHYSGIRVVKSYAAEDGAWRHFRKLCRHFFHVSMRLVVSQGLFWPFLTFFTKMVTVCLVVSTGYIVVYAWGELTTADFVSFMWIQSFLFIPVLMLGYILPVFERGRAAYDRLVEVAEEPIDVKGTAGSPLVISHGMDIEVRNLAFRYPGMSELTLSGINLKIKGGSFVGITGPVGCGKSTLLHLLNHDYRVPCDTIYIGDHNICEYSLENLHQGIVLIEQIPYIFGKTIAENIGFSADMDRQVTHGALVDAAALADFDHTVKMFPEKYDTMVGERGVTLSGGQKQRLSLARAFFSDRSIILLDDALSSVDAETEQHIFQAMKNRFSGKTVILVTHRISVMEQMDQIFYMIDGKIVEEGGPEDLLKKKGHFAALAELQSLNTS